MLLLHMPGLTLLLFMILTACKGRAVELATAAVNVALLHIKEFSCCCAHYCHCFCCCCSSSEPPLYARALYDFTARNGRELSITKGDVVQVKLVTRWGESEAEAGWAASLLMVLFLGRQTGGEKVQPLVAHSQPWRGRQRSPKHSGADEQRQPSGRGTGEPS